MNLGAINSKTPSKPCYY